MRFRRPIPRKNSPASRFGQAFPASAAAALVVAIACLSAITPARAQTTFWDFQDGNGSWASTGLRLEEDPTPANFWTYFPGSHWHVTSEGTTERATSAYFLTSPSMSGLSGTVPAFSARVSIAHDFRFKSGVSGLPIWAGQFEYQFNGSGPWRGLPLAAFPTGSVSTFNPVFGFSPFWSGTLQIVDQASFVVPNYLTPTGVNALPFVSPGGATFTGTSPGWPTAYVPTEALLSFATGEVPVEGISSMLVRFTNLNRGAGCLPEDGWNVRFVQVDFSSSLIPTPEPGTLALAGSAVAVMAAAARFRSRRHQRYSRPSDNP